MESRVSGVEPKNCLRSCSSLLLEFECGVISGSFLYGNVGCNETKKTGPYYREAGRYALLFILIFDLIRDC